MPHIGICVVEVQFVANSPHQNSRMVFEFQNFTAHSCQLGCNGFLIIVIETMALFTHIQSQTNGYPEAMGSVQQVHRIRSRTPPSNRIASDRSKKFEVPAPSGSVDIVRVTASVQLKRTICSLYLNRDGAICSFCPACQG